MFFGKYNPSVLVTYLGVILALLGIVFASGGDVRLGMLFLMLAGICDLFDGSFARKFKRNSEELAFGVQIDSLADMVNFIALPIVILLHSGCSNPFYVILFAAYALAGLIRLAYFNITTEERSKAKKPSYRGVPVTYAALVFPMVFIISRIVPTPFDNLLLPSAMGVLAFLFVLDIPVPKPRGLANIFFLLLAVALTVLLFMVRN
jgi:CDP-diacylglycerol--serine O-phosphatidyltransferase